MSKRITWIVSKPVTQLPNGTLTSTMSSTRYRVLSPISELNKLGYQNAILTVLTDTLSEHAYPAVETDVLIISKSIYSSNEKLARHAKQSGGRVIVDICDNVFTNRDIAAHYRNLLKVADEITCSTQSMGEVIRQHTNLPIAYIDDPYEAPLGQPSFTFHSPLKIVWFGGFTNFDTLEKSFGDLLHVSSSVPMHFSLVTNTSPKLHEFCAMLSAQNPSRFTMTAHEWTIEKQWQIIRESDAVYLPSFQHVSKQVKSPNRVVDSLRLGKPVLASPIPSYEQFSPWIWIGDNVADGINWLREGEKKIPFLIQMAQDYIETTFAPQIVAAEWEQAILGGTSN